jgi:hypothetical protein
MNKLAAAIPLILTAACSWGADATNAPSRLDFPSFKLISERNIFNANRSKGRTYQEPRRVEPERRYVRTESFALVGTMSYEKGRFAFFEGSSSQFNQVLKTSDTIGGFKITEVTPNSVKLASTSTNNQPVELPVGMQLKRQDEGEWKLSERTDIPRSYASSSSSSYRSGSSSSSGSSRSSGPEDSEVLKRLMQRRDDNGTPEAAPGTEPAPAAAGVQEPVAESVPSTEKAANTEKPASGSSGGADDILKKLLEKREQEINK